LEVHRQYNLRSKKREGSSPKKTIEKKKVVETKKASEPSAEKIPKKSTAEVPVKKSLTILKRSSQAKVSPTTPPSTSGQKSVADKPELMSQRKISYTFQP
jgi:hypothetical protein